MGQLSVGLYSIMNEPRGILADTLMYGCWHTLDNEGFILLVIFPAARKRFVGVECVGGVVDFLFYF